MGLKTGLPALKALSNFWGLLWSGIGCGRSLVPCIGKLVCLCTWFHSEKKPG